MKTKQKKNNKQKSISNRMDIFKAFLTLVGQRREDVADRLGVTRMTVCNWLHHDDMRLSQLTELFSLFGYRLIVHLKWTTRGRQSPRPKRSLSSRFSDKRLLRFLCVALDRNNISIKDLAKTLDLDVSVVNRMFYKDDITLSRIEQIAKAYGFGIIMRAVPFADDFGEDNAFAIVIPQPYSSNILHRTLPRQTGNFGLTHGRLDFFRDFMTIRGWTSTQLANVLGVSKSAVVTWFAQDDFSIANIFRACSAAGYSLSLALTDRKTGQTVHIGPIPAIPENPGLHTLKQAFAGFGITARKLADCLSQHPATIRRTLRMDTFRLSQLVRAADRYGLSINFRIEPTEPPITRDESADFIFTWSITPRPMIYP